MDQQPDTTPAGGAEALHVTAGDDTGDVIDKSAHDPIGQPVEDPNDPSYVEPAHAAVRVPRSMFGDADPALPPGVARSVAETEEELTRRVREMTGRDDIRVVFETERITPDPTPTGAVGSSLPDAPDFTAEADPGGCS